MITRYTGQWTSFSYIVFEHLTRISSESVTVIRNGNGFELRDRGTLFEFCHLGRQRVKALSYILVKST